MVISENRTSHSVRKKVLTISTGLYFMIKALTMADSKMPVPVADSRFRVKTAVSLCGTGTTGGIFSIRLCRPAIGKAGA